MNAESCYKDWLEHRMSCEKCYGWFTAKPPYDVMPEPPCPIGLPLYKALVEALARW